MIALAYILGGLCVLLGVTAALAFRSALSSKDARMAALDLYRAQQGVTDEVTTQRDRLATANATLTDQLSAALAAKDTAEARATVLAAKVVKMTVQRAAEAPVGDEGAAIVNDLFAAPLPGAGGKP